MRYSAEHYRNYGMSMMELSRKGLTVADAFCETKDVIIYGYSIHSRDISLDLKELHNVLCFIDRNKEGDFFEGIPIYRVSNPIVEELVMKHPDVVIIVTPYSYYREICEGLRIKFPNTRVVSLYWVFSQVKRYNSEKLYGIDINSYSKGYLEKFLDNEKSDIKRIIVTGTVYTLLLCMLLLDEWESTLFLVAGPHSRKMADELHKNEIPVLFEDDYVYINHDINYAIAEYGVNQNLSVWGHDHTPTNRAFLEMGINVVEDGTGNYYPNRWKEFKTVLDSFEFYKTFGEDPLVKSIYLLGYLPIPDIIKEKVRLFDLRECWNNKSEDEKAMIMDIFGFPKDKITEDVKSGHDVLLCTRSFENKDLKKEEIIDFYKEIIDNYGAEKMLIKPHPRDNLDYENEFPGCRKLDGGFPIQLLSFIDVGIRKVAVTGISTVAMFFKGDNVDVYDDSMFKDWL